MHAMAMATTRIDNNWFACGNGSRSTNPFDSGENAFSFKTLCLLVVYLGRGEFLLDTTIWYACRCCRQDRCQSSIIFPSIAKRLCWERSTTTTTAVKTNNTWNGCIIWTACEQIGRRTSNESGCVRERDRRGEKKKLVINADLPAYHFMNMYLTFLFGIKP